MPTITAQSIVNKALLIAQDIYGVRWTPAEGLDWLNDGVREVCNLRTDACVKQVAITLVDGTRQTLPADGVRVLDVPRNFVNLTPGAAIRPINRKSLDTAVPNWHAKAPATAVQHFMVEENDPTHFYVYPRVAAGVQVEVLYQAQPTAVATLGSVITIDDSFQNPLIDFILYRFFSKDMELASNAERAMLHRQAFERTLGLKASSAAASTKDQPRA